MSLLQTLPQIESAVQQNENSDYLDCWKEYMNTYPLVAFQDRQRHAYTLLANVKGNYNPYSILTMNTFEKNRNLGTFLTAALDLRYEHKIIFENHYSNMGFFELGGSIRNKHLFNYATCEFFATGCSNVIAKNYGNVRVTFGSGSHSIFINEGDVGGLGSLENSLFIQKDTDNDMTALSLSIYIQFTKKKFYVSQTKDRSFIISNGPVILYNCENLIVIAPSFENLESKTTCAYDDNSTRGTHVYWVPRQKTSNILIPRHQMHPKMEEILAICSDADVIEQLSERYQSHQAKDIVKHMRVELENLLR